MKTDSTLWGIQYLRAIAALMVAYYHTCVQIPAYVEALSLHGVFDASRLRAGVDLFFVISGFVMWVTSQHIAPGEFIRRRLIRIVPLYWLLTGAIVVLALAIPAAFRTTQVSGTAILKSLLFIPYLNHGDYFPLLVPGWTLNYEMFFYAIFALALFTRHRLALVGIVLGSLVLLGSVAPTFYTNPIIAEFWCGMLLGYGYNRGWLRRIPLPVAVGLIVAGFAGLVTAVFGDSRAVNPLCATAMVASLVGIEQAYGLRRVGWLALLGDASYSLYLTHLFTLGVLRVLWVRLFPDNPWCFAAVAMVLVSVVAVGVYRNVEMPMLAWFKRASRPRMVMVVTTLKT